MDKKKVLIIDDEVDFCLLMQFYLSKKNCDVRISHTLHDGLGSVYKNTPDIVILDNNLPDGLGWQEAKNIRNAVPGVQLFLISANKPAGRAICNSKELNKDSDDQDESDEDPHCHIVEKPISISQIDNFLK
jgi:DNA-binding NtrC family response regulator